MNNELFKLAASQGVWAALFVTLLFYVLKQNGQREQKYQEIISELTQKFECIEKFNGKFETLESGITDIKEEIKTLKK